MLTRFAKWLPFGLVVAGFALLGAPREARAVLILSGTISGAGIPGGSVTVFASDGNTATGLAPAGAIILNDTSNNPLNTNPLVLSAPDDRITLAAQTIVPNYAIQSSTSFDIKSGIQNSLNSSANDIVNKTGSTVTTNIAVGDVGFVGPIATVSASAGGQFTNGVGSTYSVAFYTDPTNTQFTDVTSIPGSVATSHNFGAVPSTPNPFAYPGFNSGDVAAANPNPFGQTIQFTFTLVTGGTFNGRQQSVISSAVPEPATFAMALGGLPILGVYWLRRRRQEA